MLKQKRLFGVVIQNRKIAILVVQKEQPDKAELSRNRYGLQCTQWLLEGNNMCTKEIA